MYDVCYITAMERTTIFLPPELRRRLADEARRRSLPQAVLVREALTRFLDEGGSERPRLIGSAAVEGVDARSAKSWVRGEWSREARKQ